MSAAVWVGEVEIFAHSPGNGISIVGVPSRGKAYVAYCLECTDNLGIGWRGPAHIVGLESAPNSSALDDAHEHDRMAGHAKAKGTT